MGSGRHTEAGAERLELRLSSALLYPSHLQHPYFPGVISCSSVCCATSSWKVSRFQGNLIVLRHQKMTKANLHGAFTAANLG